MSEQTLDAASQEEMLSRIGHMTRALHDSLLTAAAAALRNQQ